MRLTRRNIVQKYYTQAEIKAFPKEVLDEEAIPIAPGVHYVLRDKDAKQRLLLNRYRSHRNLLHVPSRQPYERPERPRRDCAAEEYKAHRKILDHLWTLRLDLSSSATTTPRGPRDSPC